MTPKENKVLQKALDVYKGRLTTFYEETIRKTTDELERTLTELEALKRYPTADEVCKALSEYYNEEVLYDERRQAFHFKNSWYIVTFDNGYIQFAHHDYWKFDTKKPSLITLIGRFYEGLEHV